MILTPLLLCVRCMMIGIGPGCDDEMSGLCSRWLSRVCEVPYIGSPHRDALRVDVEKLDQPGLLQVRKFALHCSFVAGEALATASSKAPTV